MNGKTYASLNWRERATEVKLRAEGVNDTLAGADAALSPYGIRFINERGLHVYEEWPGLDRRKVSGSVWNPIGLAFLVALMRNPMFLLVVRLPKPSEWQPEKTRCAHRTWKSAKQLVSASREPALFSHPGIGRAWEEDTAARDTLLDLQSMALDRGAPVPLCRQQEDLTGRSSEKRSYLIERGVDYPGAAIGHGGATKQEKRRATFLDGRVNARIGELRELESNQSNRWQPAWQLDNLDYWSGRNRPQSTIQPITGVWAPWVLDRGYPGFYRFEGKIEHHPSWPWIKSELAKLVAKPPWEKWVEREIYKIGTERLERPMLGKDLFGNGARIWEWFKNNKRREQMKMKLPQPTSGPCRKLNGPVPGVSVLGGWLACGWRGGRCCRHISCPLKDCRTPWTARSGGGCDDD